MSVFEWILIFLGVGILLTLFGFYSAGSLSVSVGIIILVVAAIVAIVGYFATRA